MSLLTLGLGSSQTIISLGLPSRQVVVPKPVQPPRFPYGPSVRIVVPDGEVDGSNRLFILPGTYATRSTKVFLNGFALRREWANGWVEVAPNKIRMKEAPLPGDDIQVYYEPFFDF